MKQTLLIVSLLVFSSFSYGREEPATVVGSLRTQNYIVEVWRVQQASLYVVKGESGKQLTGKISATEVAATFPELRELVGSGVADHAILALPKESAIIERL